MVENLLEIIVCAEKLRLGRQLIRVVLVLKHDMNLIPRTHFVIPVLRGRSRWIPGSHWSS